MLLHASCLDDSTVRTTGSDLCVAASSAGGRLAGRLQAGRSGALGAFRAQKWGSQESPVQGVRVVAVASVLLHGGVLWVLEFLRSRRPPEPGWSARLLLGLHGGRSLAADDKARQLEMLPNRRRPWESASALFWYPTGRASPQSPPANFEHGSPGPGAFCSILASSSNQTVMSPRFLRAAS